MNILFPTGIFYPATVGGPSSTLYWHTCYLKKNNINPYVVTTDFKISVKDNVRLNVWIKNEVGNVIYCKTKNQVFPAKALYEIFKKIPKCSIVHYSSAYHCFTLYTILFSILLCKKVILSPRGELFSTAIDSKKKKIAIIFYKLLANRILFHATSQEEYNVILGIIPKAKIIIQPNFINIKTFNKTKITDRNIIFLGIIYRVKKIENVIKALSKSNCFLLSNSSFLIAGKPLLNKDFEYYNELIELITKLNLSNKVKFVGELFKNEKIEFLKNAYVLILPSDSENFGNVVVEAMSQSTPVIASTGTPWSILNEKNAGWWIDNNIDSLSKTIDEVLSLSEESYLEKCRNSLSLIKNYYDVNTSKQNIWKDIYLNKIR